MSPYKSIRKRKANRKLGKAHKQKREHAEGLANRRQYPPQSECEESKLSDDKVLSFLIGMRTSTMGSPSLRGHGVLGVGGQTVATGPRGGDALVYEKNEFTSCCSSYMYKCVHCSVISRPEKLDAMSSPSKGD